jgi:glycosyltransferase involved in cell wall biosynthesis
MHKIGVVAIARNEGDRLLRCLQSLKAELPEGMPIIYVDSGSTDGSQDQARRLGVEVLDLDMSLPFTMARGRNTGFAALVERHPDLEYVQFIDGDCELVAGWLEQAVAKLSADSKLAIVCGRRRERFPEASPYNRLADLEWNTPVGETKACGGDALARVEAIRQVGGYNPSLICGEEPEMCIRLRRMGWKIYRLETEMTLHDASMLVFGQWWKRSVRGGWAVAEGAALYGQAGEQYMKREETSGWLWGAYIPLVAIALLWPTHLWSLGLFGLYPLLSLKIYGQRQRSGEPIAQARLLCHLLCHLKVPPNFGAT